MFLSFFFVIGTGGRKVKEGLALGKAKFRSISFDQLKESDFICNREESKNRLFKRTDWYTTNTKTKLYKQKVIY